MYIKFFARGVGGGTGPVDYCCNRIVPKFDPETRRRINGQFVTRDPAPVIVSGDKNRTRTLIDCIDNKWKYTSGVLAFELNDNPSEADQLAVIDDFEKTAFAGLDKDQYDILWIRHAHEGNIELHYVTPRVELETGNALNIAPPGYQDLFNAFRNKWNYSKGWASPDEPDRKKLVQQDDHIAKMDAALFKANLPKSDDPKRLITEFLLQRLEAGLLTNRDDVISALTDAEIEITRQGKDYISVRPEPGAKPIRLKGVLYDQRFEGNFDRAKALRFELGQPGGTAESQDDTRSWRNPDDDAKRASDAAEVLNRIVIARSSFNKKRYCRPDYRDSELFGAEHGIDKATIDSADIDIIGSREQNRPSTGGGVDSDRSGERKNNIDLKLEKRRDSEIVRQNQGHSYQPTDSDTERDQAADEAIDLTDESSVIDRRFSSPNRLPDSVIRDLGLSTDTAIYSENGDFADGDRETFGDSQPGMEDLQDRGERSSPPVQKSRLVTIFEKLKEFYDTTRTAIIGSIASTWAAIRGGHESIELASVQLGQADRRAVSNFEQSSGDLDKAIQLADLAGDRTHEVKSEFNKSIEQCNKGVRKMIENNTDELKKFKTDIDLVEYAESLGYVRDAKESSRNSALMRMGGIPGAEKIVIATDTDGHGIYFSLADDSDNGTIIDFVQKRKKFNLGQLRRELRPWIGVGSAAHLKRKPESERPAKLLPSKVDVQGAWLIFNQFKPAAGEQVYLEDVRRISTETLSDPRFINRIRIDARGNAVFPHYDKNGFSGFELKNEGFTGFSKGGVKALWRSSNCDDAKRIVFVEATIDALSHAQMNPDHDCAYVSTGGTPSKEQIELIGEFLADAHSRGVQVVIGTDNDEGGDKLAEELLKLAPNGMVLERDLPKRRGEDWNNQLVGQSSKKNAYELIRG